MRRDQTSAGHPRDGKRTTRYRKRDERIRRARQAKEQYRSYFQPPRAA